MSKKYKSQLEALSPKKKITASEAIITKASNEDIDELHQTQLIIEIINLFNELTPKYQNFALKEMRKAKKKPSVIELKQQENLDLNETAYYLNVDPRTITNWLKKGIIHGEKKKGKWFFSSNEIQRILEEIK